ncbi:MerR family DNA-binding transcriptional regulator [Gordonia sp. MMO-8]|uniref:MerR family DNA-binding transcriptional regulator n=1 Tax=Gordonia sp. MMO-8 TaxID=3127886 RepID=UPI0030170359
MSFMSIGEVAERFGVDPQSVRRWEASGLLPVGRTAGGHRRYDSTDVDAFESSRFKAGVR